MPRNFSRLYLFLAAPPHVISLPDDDDDEVPLRERRTRKKSTGVTPRTVPEPEAVVQEGGDVTRTSVTFVVPLTTVHPSSSTADPSSFFAKHPVPEDQMSAAKEAIRQAGIMMEQVKMVRNASQAAYDASSALQSNVQVSRLVRMVFEEFLSRRSFQLYTHWVRYCLFSLVLVGAR